MCRCIQWKEDEKNHTLTTLEKEQECGIKGRNGATKRERECDWHTVHTI